MKLDRTIYEYKEHMDMEEEDHEGLYQFAAARGGDYAEWRRTTGHRGMLFGIELELESKRGFERDDIVKSFPEMVKGDGPPPVFENDGSLDHVRGVEIIFPPVKPRVLRDPSSYFNKALASLRRKRVVAEVAHAGMHINVNCYELDNEVVAMFCAVIHFMPKRKYRTIAGRYPGGYTNQLSTDEVDSLDELLDYDDHEWCVEVHEDRIECRYPKASLDPEHIERNLTFIEVLMRFAKSPVSRKIKEPEDVWPAFVKWLNMQEKPDAVSIKEALA